MINLIIVRGFYVARPVITGLTSMFIPPISAQNNLTNLNITGGTGLLTTNDRKRIEVAMLNHTTHPQGRDSHNLNKYIWRFIALSTAQPRVITIEATSEQEARQQASRFAQWLVVTTLAGLCFLLYLLILYVRNSNDNRSYVRTCQH
ncbi:host cell division inhibitor Icd-like protein [Escherichia coli]|uniref:host cell division inhibitor Icd-like protein n=1 Tax=Escherichia coli TaxID=562 RepID=UPI002036611D|nr:host cell division inhibitor Icd-like protein [Escherichia coli]